MVDNVKIAGSAKAKIVKTMFAKVCVIWKLVRSMMIVTLNYFVNLVMCGLSLIFVILIEQPVPLAKMIFTARLKTFVGMQVKKTRLMVKNHV
jgi:hypothetical protein